MNIAIVLINWNGKQDTIECIQSLSALEMRNHDVDIVVVDNGSDDDSATSIPKKFPHVKLVRLDQNTGFTGGCNAGIQKSMQIGAEYVWLLNNDTTVHTDALYKLVETFAKHDIGIVGSKIYFSKGHEYHKDRYTKSQQGKVIWYAGGMIDWNNVYASHRGVDEVDQGQYDELEETMFVTGCSMMISKSLIQDIGLFDERFFLYLEDVEYCMRAKRNGYKVVYNPSSMVWHKNAQSSDGPGNKTHDYYLTRNRILFGMKYASIRTKFALLRESVAIATSSSQVRRRAALDGLLGRYGKRSI